MIERQAHPKHPKAYIYKQQRSNNWTMEFITNEGKRVRKSAKTSDRQEALDLLSEILLLQSKVAQGYISINHSEKPTVKRVANEAIKQIERKTSGTMREIDKTYILKIKLFADQFGQIPIDKITDDHFYKYLNNGYSKTVLRCMKTALKRIFSVAYKRNYIEKIPEIPSDIQTKESRNVQGLNDEQQKALFTRLNERYSMLLATTYKMDVPRHRKATPTELKNAELLLLFTDVMLQTGARNSELQSLLVEDVLKEKFKDEKRHFLRIRKSKTKARKILIMPRLYEQISDYIHSNNLSPETPLFFNKHSGIVPKFTQVLQNDRENNQTRYDELGIGSITLYQLRHTFITEKIREKHELIFIAQYCGTSIKMIQEHYADEIHSVDYKFMHNPIEVALYRDTNEDQDDQRI